MAPHSVVEGQVGRWVLDTLWHVRAKSPVMSGLDSVHFVSEGLTWQVGINANDHFLHLFFFWWFHESQKLTGKSCLSIHGSKTGCLVHLWVGWWTGDWWIFITDLADYMQTNRQGQSQHVWYLGSLVKMWIWLFGSTSTTFASQCVRCLTYLYCQTALKPLHLLNLLITN